RYDKGDFWWELRNCAYYNLFDKPKIIFPNLQNANKFCLDSEGVYINAPAVFLPVANKTLLCIFNSKIVWEFLKSICVVRSGGYIEVKPQYFEQIPIPELKNEEKFEQKTDEIINNTSEFQVVRSKFTKLLESKFEVEKLSKKLLNWYELDFKGFLKELKKAKIKLSLSDESEWMQFFNEQKEKAQGLKADIEKTENEIDKMVYELYGLSEDEIAIVEGAGR
ncbi:MAG: restriction endonuclease subunit M, partial [Spirochaetia bacterium]|nr:restriction endonuclease subunit M [Spirochaetia bacterium]